ncbi:MULTISPECIES: sulfur carrier protein ThiS [Idiomarina]|uniref:Thiamine biosynthesis protein ThiS n=1 Tax=Idiomarina piscisalsi TaxID=1096243 RepID=A0ABN5AQ93_9GAMM|nr:MULTISPECIES: sulfur carrier protein ThiS [Idiomarina]ASG65951.1 thiamine biosynthesis protein ThiS [Idiomarina piscisalsi]MCJ8315556.1 sulfur carrier protein ThiS [Idiomarina sp.]NQZ15471.1 sulfur carrier protein ThiS [Idiomarina sp.]RXS44280.1 sulfur carrier protein ThiS [Idiomarina sp. 29L]
MQITVNGKPMRFDGVLRLSEFFEHQQINTAAIAVAVNGVVIHRENWHEHRLNHDDSLTIIQAVAGG